MDYYVTVEYLVHIRDYPKDTPGVHTWWFKNWEDTCDFASAIRYLFARHQQARIMAIGHRAAAVQTELDL